MSSLIACDRWWIKKWPGQTNPIFLCLQDTIECRNGIDGPFYAMIGHNPLSKLGSAHGRIRVTEKATGKLIWEASW